MARLRNAALAVVLITGVMGCSHFSIAHFSPWHCDQCDDFPTPGYGPGFSMMPGSYTGPPTSDSVKENRPAASAPSAPVVPSTPGRDVFSEPAPPTTPPPAPPATPDQGAGAR
jgi:hypothetical protein